MPEPLLHFIVPFSVLVMCGIGLKRSAFLASFALLPDLDVLLHIHRSFSHSALIILLLGAPMVLILAVNHSRRTYDAALVTVAVLSHVFLDIFTYFTPVFWPLYHNSMYIIAEMMTNMADITKIQWVFEIKLQPVRFNQTLSIDTPIFTSPGVAVTLVIFIGLVLRYSFDKRYLKSAYN